MKILTEKTSKIVIVLYDGKFELNLNHKIIFIKITFVDKLFPNNVDADD